MFLLFLLPIVQYTPFANVLLSGSVGGWLFRLSHSPKYLTKTSRKALLCISHGHALDNRVYPKIYLLEVELQILTLPKGVILSGFIRIFAILCFVSIENLFVFCRNTKTSEFSDTAKLRTLFVIHILKVLLVDSTFPSLMNS